MGKGNRKLDKATAACLNNLYLKLNYYRFLYFKYACVYIHIRALV